MSDITIRPATGADETFVRGLYFASFPAEERRPWESLWLPNAACGPSALVIESGGVPAGFFTVWHFGSFRYIEHFATDARLRGSGIGSEALRALVQSDAAPVVLEVELPGANDMASRRIEFYRRNGFETLDFHYIQPPYAPGLPELELLLMATGSVDVREVARTLHRKVYGLNP